MAQPCAWAYASSMTVSHAYHINGVEPEWTEDLLLELENHILPLHDPTTWPYVDRADFSRCRLSTCTAKSFP
jgi:hypothetical protein